MIRQVSAALAAFAFAFATLAPAPADARDRNGYHSRDYSRDYDHRRWRHPDRNDRGDAVAAGAVGLLLGLAIGSMASQPREPRYGCDNSYRRCAPPPPPCRNPCRYDQGYYRDDPRYRDSYYDDRGASAYDRDYGYEGAYDPRLDDRDRSQRCTRRVQLWDNREGRYVWVDEPC